MATTITKLSILTTLDSNGVTSGAVRLQGSLNKLSGSLGRSISTSSAIGGGALAAFAGTAYLAKKGIDQLLLASGRVDRIDELAERYDLAAKSVQALDLASRLGATDQETLMRVLQKMSMTVGSGGMPLDERFVQIAKGIAAIEDPGQRATKIMEIFGKSGLEASNLILSGGREIEEATKLVERFKIGLTSTDTAAVAGMNDEWDRLSFVLEGIWNKFAVALAPSMTAGLKAILDGIDRVGSALEEAGVSWDSVGAISMAAMGEVIFIIDVIVASIEQMLSGMIAAQAVLLDLASLATFDEEYSASLALEADFAYQKAADLFNKSFSSPRAIKRLGSESGGRSTSVDSDLAYSLRDSRVTAAERGTADEIKLLMGIRQGAVANKAKDPNEETAVNTKRMADALERHLRTVGEPSVAPAPT